MNSSATPNTTSAVGSRWRLLRTTPLRDVVRLRLTGRLDVAAHLAGADLPAALREVVQDIIRRARLNRLERADLAEELIAHFQDGLSAGESADLLQERFGDPRQAARLLRRARKRNRTFKQQVIMRTIQFFLILVGVVVIGYGLLALRYFTGTPTISKDYLEKHQQRALAAPPEQRAWPDYRAAYVALGDLPRSVSDMRRPGDVGWPESVAYLRSHAGTLASLRQAAQKDAFGFIPDYKLRPDDVVLYSETTPDMLTGDYQTKTMIEVLLPHLGPMRVLSKALSADLRLAAEEGDAQRTTDNALAGLSLGSHVQETPFLIADLVAYAIWHVTCKDLQAVLTQQPDLFTDEQLLQLGHALAALGDAGVPRLHLEGERDMFDDILQRIYTDDGDGNGHLTAEGFELIEGIMGFSGWDDGLGGVTGPVLSAMIADRQEMQRKYEDIFALAEAELHLPYHRRPKPTTMEVRVEEIAASPTLRTRYILIATLMPALSRAAFHTDMITQKRDGLLAAVALDRYRRDRGAYPASLDALVPAYLPAVPLDRCSGEPLLYRLEGGAPLVYATGPDGDDDGGRLPPARRRRRHRRLARPQRHPRRSRPQRRRLASLPPTGARSHPRRRGRRLLRHPDSAAPPAPPPEAAGRLGQRRRVITSLQRAPAAPTSPHPITPSRSLHQAYPPSGLPALTSFGEAGRAPTPFLARNSPGPQRRNRSRIHTGRPNQVIHPFRRPCW